jgi:hypothetical protein
MLSWVDKWGKQCENQQNTVIIKITHNFPTNSSPEKYPNRHSPINHSEEPTKNWKLSIKKVKLIQINRKNKRVAKCKAHYKTGRNSVIDHWKAKKYIKLEYADNRTHQKICPLLLCDKESAKGIQYKNNGESTFKWYDFYTNCCFTIY